MLSSDRRRFLALAAAAPLAACGFTPVYGPSGAGLALRDRVRVAAPNNRLDFELVARLEQRLGRPNAPDFALAYSVATESEGIAITGDNDITRIRIVGTAEYRLSEAGTDVQRLAGQVSSFTAYSTTGTTLATNAAERDAEDRLMILLADRIADELLAGAARFS